MNNNQTKMNEYQAELLNNVSNFYADLSQQVDDSLGSLFTKDDVKKVLEIYQNKITLMISETQLPELDEVKQGTIDFKKLEYGLSEVLETVLDNNVCGSDFEIENTSFTLNYDNRVELEDYEINPNWSDIAEKINDELFDEICKLLNVYEEQ